MRPLSATEAISPAWQHTRQLLLAPRRWQTLLKIGVVAVFSQIGGCNFSSSYGNGWHLSPAVVALTLIAGFFALGTALVMVYIGSRLQFVLFEVVLSRQTTIGPIWARYSRITWPWIGLKILVFLASLAVAAPFLGLLVFYLVRHAHQFAAPAGGPQATSHLLLLFLVFFVAIIVFMLVISVPLTLVRDFAMPSLALEVTPIREAAARVLRLFSTEPGELLLYLLLRFVISFCAVIAGYAAILMAAAIGAIPGVLLWFALRHAGTPGYALMVLGWLVLGAILVAAVIFSFFALLALVCTFAQAYALYFLGGRYPLLGELLDPAPTPLPSIPDNPPLPATA